MEKLYHDEVVKANKWLV